MKSLKDLAKEIQTIEHSKGHKWSWQIFDRALKLLHDEVSEASDAWCNDDKRIASYELADALIRILHYFADCLPETDIDFVIENILDRNRKRMPHHNRKKIHSKAEGD